MVVIHVRIVGERTRAYKLEAVAATEYGVDRRRLKKVLDIDFVIVL